MRERLSVGGYCAIQLPLLEEYPCVCTQSLRRASPERSTAQDSASSASRLCLFTHVRSDGQQAPRAWLQLSRGTQTEALLILWQEGLHPAGPHHDRLCCEGPVLGRISMLHLQSCPETGRSQASGAQPAGSRPPPPRGASALSERCPCLCTHPHMLAWTVRLPATPTMHQASEDFTS